jgi:hypothetical protein
MKKSWGGYFRRMASVCVVGGATAWSSAVCFAVQLAADNASNAPYSDGWQAGDNGGFGFAPWNFDNDTIFHVEGRHEIDGPPNQSPFNQLGTAWRLGLNYLNQGNDIVRAGRGLPTPLQVGQTLSIVVDSPIEQRFFGGIFIRLNTGGGSLCYGGTACSPGTSPEGRFGLTVFNFTDANNWGRWSATDLSYTSVFKEDADSGLRMDFTLTGADTFDLKLTPLENPANVFMGSGELDNPGANPIDWIEFTHFNSATPFPDPNAADTDFFIQSMEITGPATASADFDGDGDIDGADFLRWQRGSGTTGGATLAMGNADGDADVDGDDLAIWEQQFNPSSTATSSASADDESCGCGSMFAAGAAAVPEPSALHLAAGAIVGIAGRALGVRKRAKSA